MANTKVNIEVLAQLAAVFLRIKEDIECTKEEMDRELCSFPWDDPVAIAFKESYYEKLKPVDNVLIPRIDGYIQYLDVQGGQLSGYTESDYRQLRESAKNSLGLKGLNLVTGATVGTITLGAAAPIILALGASLAVQLQPLIKRYPDIMREYGNESDELKKQADLYQANFRSQLVNSSDDELLALQQEWNEYEQYSLLADDSYKSNPVGKQMLPTGYSSFSDNPCEWKSPLDKELKKFAIDANWNANNMHFAQPQGGPYSIGAFSYSEADGFQCELYKSPQGKYVLAFRGTEAKREWYDDILNADIEGSQKRNQSQNLYAREKTKELVNILEKHGLSRNDLIVTGHSLGGRLAQEAAVENGLKAVVFNSADISRETKEVILRDTIKLNSYDKITRISSSTDMLTIAQRTNTGRVIVGPDMGGNKIIIKDAGTHSQVDLIDAIRVYKAEINEAIQNMNN